MRILILSSILVLLMSFAVPTSFAATRCIKVDFITKKCLDAQTNFVTAPSSCAKYDIVTGKCIDTPTTYYANTTQTQGYSNVQTQTQGAGNNSVQLINPLHATNLSMFVKDILDFVIRIGTIIVILMMVFVGYKFVVAQGAPGKIEEARAMLLWTIVGALILLGSQAISIAIQATVKSLG